MATERQKLVIQRQINGINHCRQILVPTKGEFRKGFVLISINQFNIEQERVVLLTKKSYWRVKYNFDTKSIERSEETPLSEVTHIEKGYFKYPKLSLTKVFDVGAQKQYGVRIYRKQAEANGVMLDGETVGIRESVNPLKKMQPFRTFRALDCVTYEYGREVINDLCAAFQEALEAIAPDSGFYVSECPLVRSDVIGPFSAVLNAWQVGHYNKDLIDDDDDWDEPVVKKEKKPKKEKKEKEKAQEAEEAAAQFEQEAEMAAQTALPESDDEDKPAEEAEEQAVEPEAESKPDAEVEGEMVEPETEAVIEAEPEAEVAAVETEVAQVEVAQAEADEEEEGLEL
ncbi:Inositol phosphatase [Carpediemonas membranifera]|uniref:Inositol phosphatase n=1 Tax=Carpediemonas membranifera TaxID=201153 RepID=A0A8J6B9M3_9EUKA|nr:Inositol phosphatase [Carpediemonas membranifera]|eukprot:KAG9395642.1 Inositol phosphatase [Carpediemonas membranifera]